MQHLFTSQWYQCTASGTYLPVNSQFWTKTHTHTCNVRHKKIIKFYIILGILIIHACMKSMCTTPGRYLPVGTQWSNAHTSTFPSMDGNVLVWAFDRPCSIQCVCVSVWWGTHQVSMLHSIFRCSCSSSASDLTWWWWSENRIGLVASSPPPGS